jgi:uncharacterized protein YukE
MITRLSNLQAHIDQLQDLWITESVAAHVAEELAARQRV